MSKETIILVPTTKCDVNCHHCMHNAGMNGADIPFEFLEKLVEKLPRGKAKANFQVTGLGESVLYPRFNDMMDLILDDYGTDELCLITSGYNHHEIEKREKLLQLFQQKYFNRVSLYLSYNLFADFNDRLSALLCDVVNSKKSMSIYIKMCMSLEGGEETVRQFERCLIETLKERSLPPATVDVNMLNLFDDRPGYLKEKRYVVDGLEAKIFLYTLFWSLKKVGRAKLLSNGNTFATSACDFMVEGMDNSMTLCPDGYFYPCDMHADNIKRRLGHVMEDSMETILQNRDVFISRLRRYLMPIRKRLGIMPCELCKILPR